METIGRAALWSFIGAEARPATNTEIRKHAGCRVETFLDLARKVAELQYRNRDHVLLFRGQNADFLNKEGNTTLKPSLFRPLAGHGINPDSALLARRFATLARAEQELLRRYEVCPTPLLDVTHSLRIAASFASIGATDEAFLFVVGVPNLSGAVTASAESGLQILRLSSVCPPTAVRPHIQEGYLLGEYPEMGDCEQKDNYQHYEIDFGRRLVAKFTFDPARFWKGEKAFPKVPVEALYPNAGDPIHTLAQAVKDELGCETPPAKRRRRDAGTSRETLKSSPAAT
ncbi:MAG: hypothetical protein KBG39_12045 [Opitutaceae bacterium]|nr:hypothetical protein [Opitutaceae bacterium]